MAVPEPQPQIDVEKIRKEARDAGFSEGENKGHKAGLEQGRKEGYEKAQEEFEGKADAREAEGQEKALRVFASFFAFNSLCEMGMNVIPPFNPHDFVAAEEVQAIREISWIINRQLPSNTIHFEASEVEEVLRKLANGSLEEASGNVTYERLHDTLSDKVWATNLPNMEFKRATVGHFSHSPHVPHTQAPVRAMPPPTAVPVEELEKKAVQEPEMVGEQDPEPEEPDHESEEEEEKVPAVPEDEEGPHRPPTTPADAPAKEKPSEGKDWLEDDESDDEESSPEKERTD